MTLLLIAVLAAAAFQSFCKLALLPRRWELLAALLLMPLPFLFEERIARTSLAAVTASLSGKATLENWCALVVIQELFSLIAGFSLLAAYEAREKIKLWKFAAFVPSALLPAGALFLQMRLFNEFPGVEFRHITWHLAFALPLAGIALAEFVRLLRREQEDRILFALHAEWFLLLAAVFLPVAANARLIPAAGTDDGAASLAPLGVLASTVLLSMLGFTVYLKIMLKHKKYHPAGTSIAEQAKQADHRRAGVGTRKGGQRPSGGTRKGGQHPSRGTRKGGQHPSRGTRKGGQCPSRGTPKSTRKLFAE